MSKKPPAEPEDEEGHMLKVNPDLGRMIVSIVTWKKMQPGAKVKTVAQYLDPLLRDVVAADFHEMIAAQQKEASRFSSRK